MNESILRTVADIKKNDLLARNKDCDTCNLFEECGIGCRASAVVEAGALMAKDPVACAIWKKGYKTRFAELTEDVP